MATWIQGWRLALRMGRRDARRHLGRSLLVVAMVGLPVAVLVAAYVLGATAQVSERESLPRSLGPAQARLTLTDGRVTPVPRPPYGRMEDETPAKPIPGWGDSTAEQTAALAALLPGATVRPEWSYASPVRGDGRVRLLHVLGIDPAAGPLDDIVTLRSGRWPRSADEVVVTRHAIAQGLPASGTLQLPEARTASSDDAWRSYTIVGVADGWVDSGTLVPAGIVMLPPEGASAFLVERTAPVTWDDVTRLAEHGVIVKSRQVVEDPPAQVTDDSRTDEPTDSTLTVTTSIGAVLMVETMLLVGPAFAVGAARQRRTLALSALNGAPVRQLRRMAVGQALVLGALSAFAGAAGGLAAAAAVYRVQVDRDPGAYAGPFEVPLPLLLPVMLAAVLSALVAALVPTRRLGRLDLVGVLRGQSVAPQSRRRVSVAGLAVGGIGAALVALTFSMRLPGTTGLLNLLALLSGLACLVVGVVLVTPTLLALLAAALRHAPLPLRMAARDAARQPGRTTSTVTAILGAVMLFTIVAVSLTSADVHGARTYQPVTVPGQGLVLPSFGAATTQDATRMERIVADVEPRLVTRRSLVLQAEPRIQESTGTSEQQVVAALREGCTEHDVVVVTDERPCASLSSLASVRRAQVTMASVEDLVARFRLSAEAEAALRAGKMLVVGDRLAPSPGRIRPVVDVQPDGTVVLVQGTVEYTETPRWVEGPETVRVGVHVLPGRELVSKPELLDDHPEDAGPGAVLSAETAARLGWPGSVEQIHVVDPAGQIDQALEARLASALLDSGLGTFYVERGYRAAPAWFLLALTVVVGTVILVASLVSTALATVELSPFLGTLAAVGATRTTRRLVAAGQAWLLAGLGGLLGAAVGLVPAVAFSLALTGRFDDRGRLVPGSGVAVVPWLVAAPVLLLPLVAALLAYVAVPRDPRVTRSTG